MALSKTIAVLEDDAERRLEMFRWLDDRFFMYRALFFRTAPQMIEWLERADDEPLLLSLDHDLHALDDDHDPGTGRDVVDFLCESSRTAQPFPIVIHTSNAHAGVGMAERLAEADWPFAQVTPYDDLAWIGTDWMRALKRVLKGRTAVELERRS